MATNLVTVEFAGAQLVGQIHKGMPYVAMRPIVDGMGLQWDRQLEKLRSHPVLKRQLSYIRGMVAEDGKRREMACLPLSRLSFWLATVNPLKVSASIQGKVILFQEQAADVLHEAFTAEQGRQAKRAEAITGKRAAARLLTDVIQNAADLDGRQVIHWDFANEHRLCNFALRGSYDAIDESTLAADEAKVLASIRQRDALLYARGLDRDDRKAGLVAYADQLLGRTPLALTTGRAAHAR